LTIINQVKIGGSFFGADPSSDQRTKNTGHPIFLLSSKKILKLICC